MAVIQNKLNSVEFMTDFINMYRSLPALWKVKSADYHNKLKKKEAFNEMVELSKSVYEDANEEFVKIKINSIRGSFRKELKKVLASRRSGASPEELYVPKLWYYELLTFTCDQEGPTESTSSIPDDNFQSTDSRQGGSCRGTAELKSQDEDESINTEGSSSLTSRNYPSLQIKRAKKSTTKKSNAMKQLLLARTEKARERDEFDSYFESVAAKMRRMDGDQRLFVEKIINEAVFKGMYKRLTEFSHVNTPNPGLPSYSNYNQELYHCQNCSQAISTYVPTSTSVISPQPSPGSDASNIIIIKSESDLT